jgi:NAD(P)-dependent dehydrogenase (short-subunit alcohol dehydrogenase family)
VFLFALFARGQHLGSERDGQRADLLEAAPDRDPQAGPGLGKKALTVHPQGEASMTRQLAVQYAENNIRVNAVAPGTIEMPWLRPLTVDLASHERHLAWLRARHPLGLTHGRLCEVWHDRARG